MKFKKLKLKTKAMLAVALLTATGLTAPLLNSLSVKAFAETAQDKLDSTNNEIDSLKSQQNTLSSELSEIQAKVDASGAKIADITEQINSIKDNITNLNKDIDDVNKKMNEEYETMKLRIQFIYESGDLGLLDALIASKDFGDFLAKAEYIQKISDYDRELLAKFDALFKDYQGKVNSLNDDVTRLASLRDEAQKESDSLKSIITEKSASLSLSEDKQAELEALALQYEKQIESERLAQEEAMAIAMNNSSNKNTNSNYGNDNNTAPVPSINNNNNGNSVEPTTSNNQNSNNNDNKEPETTPPTTETPTTINNNNNSSTPSAPVDASDLAMMAAIIECEAGNQPYEGRIAVGSVIMNRIDDPRFGNTLRDVLYAPWQFSPVMSGRFEVVLARGASETNVQAAREVLGGRRNVPYLYFHVYNGSVNPRYGSYQIIQDHIFYNY